MGKHSLATHVKQSKLEALEKKESQIHCWSAQMWTKLIGWLQCILHGFGAAGILYAIGELVWSCLNNASKQQSTVESQATKSNLALLLVLLFVLFCTVGGGFLMGVLLLKGAYTEDPSLLCWWRTYTSLSLLIYTLVTFGRSFSLFAIAWPEVFALIGIVAIQVLCVWIVGLRRQEMITHKLVPLSELIAGHH